MILSSLRIILANVFISVFFFTFTAHAFADEDFDIASQTTYSVEQTGTTDVTQNITITNKKDFIYTPSYSITMSIKGIKNIQIYNQQGSVPFTINDTQSGGKKIDINFPERVVGIGKNNEFTLKFQSDEIAKKLGNTWEISIPGVENTEDFAVYSTTLNVPQSFGPPSVVKPSKQVADSTENTYTFTKNDLDGSGILITFGEFEYYKLELTYTISNANLFPIKTEIALPQTTAYQTTVLKNIDPKPRNTYQDKDSNWLAEYRLNPHEQKVIKAIVYARVSSDPREQETLTTEQKKQYTQPAEHWEVNSPQIQKLAQELKTPEKIYDYLVTTLEYNYDKVAEENNRLGAIGALNNPTNCVCLEFTDLFVTIARAANIPSRAVEGYAYTQDSRLRPLSLVQDILHAWPEYYDEKRKEWVMVDPTWGNTTNGIDYFNSLDFSHITFVKKGLESTYPIPAGGYKVDPNSKDVKVSFIKPEEFIANTSSDLEFNFSEFNFSFLPVKGSVFVHNTGNSQSKPAKLNVETILSDKNLVYQIPDLPPGARHEIVLEFPKKDILTNEDYLITMHFNGQTKSTSIHVGLVPVNEYIFLGGGIFAASIIVLTITLKARSIYIQRRKQEDDLHRQSS